MLRGVVRARRVLGALSGSSQVKSQVIGTAALLADPAWSILRGMAREGRWGRGRAARREAAETAGAVQSADATAAPAPPAPLATTTAPDREPEPDSDPSETLEPEPRPFRLGNLTPFLLVRAAHPRQALITAVGMTVAAALAGGPAASCCWSSARCWWAR